MTKSEDIRSAESLPRAPRPPLLLPGRVAVLALAIAGVVYWVSGESDRSAIEAVKRSLRDPDSAKFRNVRKLGSGVCGEVNAKNAYGGMVGYEKFFVHLSYVDGEPGLVFLENSAPAIVGAECKG